MSWIVNILATLIYLGFGIIYAVDFSKRKHFRYFYCSDSGSNFSDTGRDVFIVSGGKLVWSNDVDVTGICADDAVTVGECKNDDGGRILLCSMGILYLVSCL